MEPLRIQKAYFRKITVFKYAKILVTESRWGDATLGPVSNRANYPCGLFYNAVRIKDLSRVSPAHSYGIRHRAMKSNGGVEV
jgi:hypothetical protein